MFRVDSQLSQPPETFKGSPPESVEGKCTTWDQNPVLPTFREGIGSLPSSFKVFWIDVVEGKCTRPIFKVGPSCLAQFLAVEVSKFEKL